MTLRNSLVLSSALVFGLGSAQLASAQVLNDDGEIDCSVASNAEAAECLNLPDDGAPITNFAPIVAPLVGAAILGAAGGSGGTPSTTGTTSTTSTSTTSTSGT